MGPSDDSFEYKAAVRQWRKQKQRRLARLYRPAKRTKNAPHYLGLHAPARLCMLRML